MKIKFKNLILMGNYLLHNILARLELSLWPKLKNIIMKLNLKIKLIIILINLKLD